MSNSHITGTVLVTSADKQQRNISYHYQSPYYVPNLNFEPYTKDGDINIGALISMSLWQDKAGNGACSTDILSYVWQHTEIIAFAVDFVNRHPSLLQNVTLGFAMLNDCFKEGVAITSSLAFLPRQATAKKTRTVTTTNDNDNNYTDNVNRNAQFCSEHQFSSSSSSSSSASPTTTSRSHYDVIGVISPSSSRLSVDISSLYSVAKLPIVGYVSTSDELSDKSDHPYYFRVVPPDRHQVEAMLKFISDNGWSYISVVYSQGSYGEKAFDNIKEKSHRFGICLATHHRLTSYVNFDLVAADLVAHSRARVVILFMPSTDVKALFDAVKALNYSNHFVWSGSDAWSYSYNDDFEHYKDIVVGAFSFAVHMVQIPAYYDYLRKQRVETSRSPFMRKAWEYMTDCSFADSTCDTSQNVLLSNKISYSGTVSLLSDAVLAFAYAADGLLRDRCPGARAEEARACITGEILHAYLANTSFDGFTGHVEFDEHYDAKGKYEIRQIVYDYMVNPYLAEMNESLEMGLVGRVIALYDMTTEEISYTSENISWTHLRKLERLVPLFNENNESMTAYRPESVCSRPCYEREYKISKTVPCCWECHMCRENEKLLIGQSTCEACPAFTWPYPGTRYTTCNFIPLSFPRLTESLPVIVMCTAVAAFLFTVLIALAYVKYRNERIIKAASRELSFLQLAAILLGYVTVIVFQLKPSDATCKMTYFLFCLTFALLYCPLLVKTVRIYRIFAWAARDNQRPRFISPRSQLVMSLLLIVVQILLCVITNAKFHPTSRRHQPVWSEKLVLVTCDLTLPGLTSFLTYNLVLVTLCSVFAFKTRKLPDNFNESRFISMCVYTTLIIWLAFIPTYFTAQRVFLRALLLSLSLLLNHSVALFFLFVPKIYAAIYVAPDQLVFATTRFQTQYNNVAMATMNPGRVAPISSVSLPQRPNAVDIRC